LQVSKDGALLDGAGSLSASNELHLMFATERGKKFLKFVTEKLSPEPFLCWCALQKLVEEVRENTLESAESRSSKVKAIVEEFVLDTGKNQLGLVKEVCFIFYILQFSYVIYLFCILHFYGFYGFYISYICIL
jgi:hypothetical protein